MRYMIPMTDMNVLMIAWIVGGTTSVVIGMILQEDALLALGVGFGIPGAIQLIMDNVRENSKPKTDDKNSKEDRYTWQVSKSTQKG